MTEHDPKHNPKTDPQTVDWPPEHEDTLFGPTLLPDRSPNGSGINYGRPLPGLKHEQTNTDPTNGIHYGVIPAMEVLEAWALCCDPVYPDPEDLDENGEIPEEAWDLLDPLGYTYERKGYIIHSDDRGDLFILTSPYFTRAKFCSPCAPGACHLNNPDPDGARTYCLGPEWFDSGYAPYPVFSVKTGERIDP
jgi:hypothetical protein